MNIKEVRKQLGITQQELANLLDITEEHMNRIENDKRRLTKKIEKELEKIFSFYKTEEPLMISFDFVRIRFSTTDYKFVIEKFLKMKSDYFYHEPYGHYGYNSRFVYGNIVVMFHTDPRKAELGVLLDMSGQGCRHFELVLSKQNRDWLSFFSEVLENNGVMKRIDLAIDDKVGILDIQTLIKKRNKGELISKFRKTKDINSKDGDDHAGATLNFGTRKSKVSICIYEKNYEQSNKYGTNPELEPVKNRVEVRLREERADKAMDTFVFGEDVEHLALNILHEYIVFLEPSTLKDKRRWKVNPRWQLFIGLGRKGLKLTTKPEHISLDRTKDWIERQVAASCKMLKDIDEVNGTSEFEDMIKNAKLSKKQIALIEQATTAIDEVVM